MDKKTLEILNKLHRGGISYKRACRILNKTENEIDKLFDSKDYVYRSTIKEEKRLFELEKQNIIALKERADSKQFEKIDFYKNVYPTKDFVQTVYLSYSQDAPFKYNPDSVLWNYIIGNKKIPIKKPKESLRIKLSL